MFDSHTIYLVGFVSQVVFALTLALLAFSDRRTRGTVWLAACSGLQLIMTFVRALLHSQSDTVVLSAGSCLIVLAAFFLYMGLRWFAVRRPLATRNGPIAVSAGMLAVLAISAFYVPAGLMVARLAAIGMMAMMVPMLWRTRMSGDAEGGPPGGRSCSRARRNDALPAHPWTDSAGTVYERAGPRRTPCDDAGRYGAFFHLRGSVPGGKPAAPA